MVQDMKRGGSIRNRDVDGSVRRRGSVLGIGSSEADGEPLGRRRTHNSEAPSETAVRPTGRGRSLSGALNDLWRGLRGQSSREELGGDLESEAR